MLNELEAAHLALSRLATKCKNLLGSLERGEDLSDCISELHTALSMADADSVVRMQWTDDLDRLQKTIEGMKRPRSFRTNAEYVQLAKDLGAPKGYHIRTEKAPGGKLVYKIYRGTHYIGQRTCVKTLYQDMRRFTGVVQRRPRNPK